MAKRNTCTWACDAPMAVLDLQLQFTTAGSNLKKQAPDFDATPSRLHSSAPSAGRGATNLPVFVVVLFVMDAASALFSQQPSPEGRDLCGREILVCWDDGVWYDAVVVCYYMKDDEYKLVYRADDGIEIAKLRDRRWILAPKKKATPNRPVLDGAMIEFEYPSDGKRYKAMVYDYSHNGARLKIAYIDEHTTDNLKGGGWDFLTTSPCLEDPDEIRVQRERERDRVAPGKRRISKGVRKSSRRR